MNAFLGLALSTILLLSTTAIGQETWINQYSSPDADTILTSVNFSGTDTGYAVGRFGKILRHTPLNGWQDQVSGVTNHLLGVHFTSPRVGYAVGASGIILKTTNGGNSWILKPSGTTVELRAVFFSTANTGFVVGVNGTILKTIDGGNTWSQTIYGNGQIEFNAVQMVDSNKGFIAGYYQSGRILATNDAGNTWNEVESNGAAWRGMHFPSSNVGYVTGGGGSTYFGKTTDGGQTWSVLPVPSNGNGFSITFSYAVHFVNNDTGYIVGDGLNIAKTINGGTTWTYPGQLLGSSSSLNSVYFTSTHVGYAVGPNRIFKNVYLPPSIPTLSTPAAGVQNTALSLNLSWGVIPAATTFRAQISENLAFTSPVFDDSTLLTATAFVENLDTNTTYYWRVNAKNPGGTSDWSTVRSFTTVPLKPDAPTAAMPLPGAVNTALSPTLTWNTTARAVTYRVQLSTNASFTAIVKDTVQTGTSKAVGPLLNNTTYHWRVNATNPGGDGNWSATRSFTTVPVPTAPVASAPALGAIDNPLTTNLEWTASEHALTYRVQLSTDPTFATTVVNDSTVTGTTKSVGPLANNTTYYWRVNAKNGGTSGYSTTANFTTLPAPPATPALSSPAAAAINVALSSELTWASVSGAVTYHLQFSTDPVFGTTIINDSALTITTQSVGPLTPSSTYYWRVRAKNSGGLSAFSTARTFTTVPAIPPVPGLSSPAANATGVAVSTSLTWVAAAGATTYTVQLATDSTFASTVLTDSTVTTTSRAVSALLNNTSYYWRVRARNPGGASAYTATRTFTTSPVSVPALTAPLQNAANTAPSLNLTWSAVSGVTSYHVQLASDSLFASLIVNDSGLTSASRAVGPLAAGTSYFWRLRAKAPGGTGEWTPVSKFTVMSNPDAPLLVSPGIDSLNVAPAAQLVWQAVAQANTYRVQLATDSLFAALIVDDSSLTATTRATGTLNNATTYYWRVNARNAVGVGAFSVRRKFTTSALAVPSLTTPAASATNVAAQSTFTWTAVGDATGYTVQVSAEPTFTTFVVNTTVVSNSLQVGPLSPGTAYYWRVRGRNTGSDGAFSAAGQFTVMALPAVPTLLGPAPDTTDVATTLAVTWSTSAGAASYRLHVSNDSTFATLVVNDSTLTAATRTIGPLAENTTYYWRVNAKNAGGTSAFSPTRRFTTIVPISLKWAHIAFHSPGITGSASLRYQLPDARKVRIRLHNVRGSQVTTLLDEQRNTGSHELSLPNGLSQGVYLLEFRAGDYQQILKLVR